MWAAGFAYTQFGVSIVTGILLVPLILHSLGKRQYGQWLTGGELLQYLALVDGGIFGLLPWIVAQADGANDLPAIRRYLANAMVIGLAVGAFILLAGFGVWCLLVRLAELTDADQAALSGPLVVLTAALAVAYPLRAFTATLAGLQDVLYTGAVQVLLSVCGAALTLSLLLGGAGLYAIAIASAVPPVVGGVASLVRVRCAFPELLRRWPVPQWRSVRELFVQGLGAWVSGFGVQLLGASNGLILTLLGHPELVVIYSCTAKVPALLQQLSWVIPDSALVGLAQLHGEGPEQRLRGVLLRLYQLGGFLSATGACAVLAANPAFVNAWVGPGLFGGLALNALLAINLVVVTLSHVTVTTVAVVGGRLQVGLATLLNGLLYVGLAVPLVLAMGLPGLVLSLLLAGTVTSLAWGLVLQNKIFGLATAEIAAALRPCAVRLAPAVAVTGVLGVVTARAPFWQVVLLGVPCGLAYLWWVRPLLAGLPWPGRAAAVLARLGLLPRQPGVVVEAPATLLISPAKAVS